MSVLLLDARVFYANMGMQNILVNQKICPLKENNTGCPLIVSALDDVPPPPPHTRVSDLVRTKLSLGRLCPAHFGREFYIGTSKTQY